MKKDIEFYSEGCKIAAHFYQPDTVKEGEKLPTIILCHGFAGVKEMLLPPYAEKFSNEGFAVLSFDYRGFGESEGEQGALIPQNQVTDIRNAITFLETIPEVDADKIGLWGSSYGGANIISTALIDKRVKCLVVQLAFGNGERVISTGKTEEEIQKIKDSFYKAWRKQVSTNRVMKLGVNRFLTDPQSQEFYKEYVEKFDALKVSLPFLTMKETFEYKPEQKLHGIHIPIYFVGAGEDTVNPVAETHSLFEKANEPKDLYIVEGASHYAVYEGEMFEDVASRELDWFKKYL